MNRRCITGLERSCSSRKRKKTLFSLVVTILTAVIIFAGIPAIYLREEATGGTEWWFDVDKKNNGNYIGVGSTVMDGLVHGFNIHEQQPPETVYHPSDNFVREITPEGNIAWEFTGTFCPHEVLELDNGHLMIADTFFDRVIEIGYPGKEITYEWNAREINWTEVNPAWGKNHFYSNPRNHDWTHINDVDIMNYGSWEGMLVSIRNFDLVIEINLSAERIHPNDPSNIVWWYGDHENHSLLNHQHNPDYLPDGDVIIADSENQRTIIVDKVTKEITWSFSNSLTWSRDADWMPGGKILITDIDEVLIVDFETKEIEWRWGDGMFMAYEADALPNGNILVSCGEANPFCEVTPEGTVAWSHGGKYVKTTLLFIALTCMIGNVIMIIYSYSNGSKIMAIVRVGLIIICLLSIVFWDDLVASIVTVMRVVIDST